MSVVRLKRLAADHQKLTDYVRAHPRVRLIQAEGEPPERYQLEYRINSVRMVGTEIETVKSHLVEIVLPRNYPRTPPHCRMLSPVFHPNIAPHAICVGDHWSSGEPLVSIAIRIGEILAYQVYNVKSPLNGEAARWAEQNREKLPLDPVSLLIEEQPQPGATIATPTSLPASAPRPSVDFGAASKDTPVGNPVPLAAATKPGTFTCPQCKKSYRFREELVGQKLRCISCNAVFVMTAPYPQ